MSFENAYAALRTHLNDEWAAVNSTIPIRWPNEAGFAKPTAASGEWIEAEVLEGETFSLAAGSGPPERTIGAIVVRHYMKPGAGDGLARRRRDQLRTIWNAFSSAGFWVKESSLRRIGLSPRFEGWMEHQIRTPFEFDEPAAA